MWTGCQKPAGPALAGLASVVCEHACVYMCTVYLCVCGCVPVWAYCDSEAYHLALPPEARQNRARWRWLRRAFPPSRASTRDRVSLALCKQETCARSAHSVATVMRVTLSSLHTQHDGGPVIGWPYLAICNKALKALVWQSRLYGCVRNKRTAIIHACFIFSFVIVGVYLYSITERERQADILEIALTWLKGLF